MFSERKTRLALLLIFPLLLAQDTGDIAFDFRNEGAFGDPTRALREFLHSQRVARRKPAQSFCIVGYQSSTANDKRAWIHWPQGHKLILWSGGTAALANSRRITDLTKDVVASEADIQGSTYLVTQAWANQVLSDCATRGIKYQVRSE